MDPASFGDAIISLTIQDLGGNIAITGIPQTKPVIYKTGGGLNEDRHIFQISNPGGHTYTWYVGGNDFSGPSLLVNAAHYAVGFHIVRLTITINGVPWSMPNTLGFIVEAVKP